VRVANHHSAGSLPSRFQALDLVLESGHSAGRARVIFANVYANDLCARTNDHIFVEPV
jgi:hypothetical protein